ncbi:MAG: DUF4870 domain-containing protein [Bacteroidales bacterium]|nr:DUF4870 domain-containing protein [Bacteroidales bacterium]
MEKYTNDEKMWGMFCHLSALAGYFIPFGNIIGPLIIWSIKKDEYAFVNEQGKEAINFQISILIYIVITIPFIFILIGIPIMIAIGIFSLVMVIIAGIKANNGESFKYPLCISFIK